MTESTTPLSRREELADAAIAALAEAGMRGLTHRAVDKAAGLPEGSCSYYFRTRQALLQAAVERLEQVDTAELTARPALSGAAAPGREGAAEAAARLVEHWTTAGRERMLARYELALEATRRPELRAVLVKAGARSRELAAATLTAIGARDPARQAPLLVAYLDGLIFDHLAGAGSLALTHAELRAALLDLLHAFGGCGMDHSPECHAEADPPVRSP
ncbi:TetR/AcrR family transcriptional regulator [Actinomadura latina]|uniref:TetR family transcriptional regulator n=1 Tax=Actinomadura latina TaxID=163603 RepID=A0A846YUS6_9ACTN|nr:TetR/AcrR family transcriptional regulator [Actinomadura latina]NKZ02364.1 TetR family transcriptional regulator [Actinomadura latina]